jgi:hypothetical protein
MFPADGARRVASLSAVTSSSDIGRSAYALIDLRLCIVVKVSFMLFAPVGMMSCVENIAGFHEIIQRRISEGMGFSVVVYKPLCLE